MSIYEYDEEGHMEVLKEEQYQRGVADGMRRGIEQGIEKERKREKRKYMP